MQIMCIGASHRVGVSKKSGAAYDFAVLYCMKPANIKGSAAMQVSAVGLEPCEIRCKPPVIEQLRAVPFPAKLTLTIDNEMGDFGQLQAICTGAVLASAAAPGK